MTLTYDEIINKLATPIYDELEGEFANQDFKRQRTQWERAQRIARAALSALRTHAEKRGYRLMVPVEATPATGGALTDMIAAFWRSVNTDPDAGHIAALCRALSAAPDPTKEPE